MKKSFLKFVMLLSIFGVVLSSCSKDDDPLSPADDLSGNYTVKMDGNTISTGTSTEVGWLDAGTTMAATMAKDDFTVIVGAVPKETGGVNNFDNTNSSGTVTIMGKNLLLTDSSDELYFSVNGSITRVSETKISFEGTCNTFPNTEPHTFSGTLESDVFKIEYN